MGLKERMAAALGAAGASVPLPQQPAPPVAVAPPPAAPEALPPAGPSQLSGSQQPGGASSQPEPSNNRPSGGGLRARFAFLEQLKQAEPAPAAAATPLPQPSQQNEYRYINGRLLPVGPAAPASGRSTASQQQHQQQPASQRQVQAWQQPSQAAASQPLPVQQDGIDRSAARAKVVLSASQDDFDFDPSELLKAGSTRTSGARRGGEPATAAQKPSTQELQLESELDDFLPNPSQRAAAAKPAKPRGKRAGTATTPGGAQRRKLAGDGAKANSKRSGGGGVGGGQKRRKAAAPKRKLHEQTGEEACDEVEEEAGDKEDEGGLLDQLLLTPSDLMPTSPALQQPQAEQQQQEQLTQQQLEPQPVPVHAPTDGPHEELRMAVGEDGEPWPEDAEEEPHLDFAVPGSINRFLRSYQRDGIRFLMRQYARGCGGLLADDMGLGKTVQAIGFIAAVLGKTGGTEDLHQPALEPLETIDPIPAQDDKAAGEWDLSHEMYKPDYARCYPILVGVPTSVVTNWEREFAMWGKFRVAVCDSRHRDSAVAAIKMGQKEIMIVSYHILRDKFAEDVLSIPWHMAVFDEAHILKTTTTQKYKLFSRLPTRLRYGLTGTPFQNDYGEIWGVMNFVAPGCLGSRKEFMEQLAMPMMRGQKAGSTDIQKAAGAEAQRDLRRMLVQYLLRRTKKLIADQLPKKIDYAVFCELSPLQLAAYKRLLESPDLELLLNYRKKPCPECGQEEMFYRCCGWRVDAEHGGVLWPMYHECECDDPYDKMLNPKGCKSHKPEGCWRLSKFGGFKRMCPFCLVLPCCSILRKISNHLELVKAHHEDRERDPIKFNKALQVAELVIGEDRDLLGGYVTSEDFIRLSDTATCGKMEALAQLLSMWHSAGSNKVLLFSNSVQMLNILRSMVIAKGYDYVMLDGSTKQEERQALCDTFNHQPSTFIFLISTQAGGVGLNLTSANKVVIVDPNWNPAMDLQAQDRAFRIGQKRDVSVYRLIAAGTMEEIIYDRQLYKQMHSEMVLEGRADIPRTFQGAKTGDRQDHGELFGMINLLKHNKERIMTLDILKQERQRRGAGIRIQEFDPAAAAAEQQAAVGAARPLQRNDRRGSRGAAGGGGGEVGVEGVGMDDEDYGLQALVEAELGLLEEAEAEEQQEQGQDSSAGPAGATAGAGAAPAPAPAGGQPGRGLLPADQGEEETWAEQRDETELLARAGVTGMLQHNLALKPCAAEAAATWAAEEAVDANSLRKEESLATKAVAQAGKRRRTQRTRPEQVAGGASGGSGDRVTVEDLPLLESLAEALGLSVTAMARQLLETAPEQRQELRESVARGDDPSLAAAGEDAA